MFALPCNKVVIRREGIELNPNAQLLPVPRARRYRGPPAPQEEPPVAKARMEERAEAKAPRMAPAPLMAPVPFALPDQRANGGDQIARILAGPPALRELAVLPKRSNAANPLPEPYGYMANMAIATRQQQQRTMPKRSSAATLILPMTPAPFSQWHRSPNAIPLPDANGYIAKAGAALPPPTVSPGVLAGVVAMAPAAVPGDAMPGPSVLANAIVAKAASLPPGVGAKAASLPPSRAVAPTVYEDMMRRARALDEWNAGLDEPRMHTIHTPSHIDYIARWLPQTIRN